MTRSVSPQRSTRPFLRVGRIVSKHLDKSAAGDSVPNVLHHQLVRGKALGIVDESSEIGRSPLFHCENSLTVSLLFVNQTEAEVAL